MSWEEQEKLINKEVKTRREMYSEYLEQLQSFRCVICGEPGGHRRFWDGRQVVLCDAHTNAWQEYITAHPLWLRWVELEARYDVSIYAGDEKSAVEFKRQGVELRKKGCELSGKWLGMAMEQHDIDM